MMNGERKEGICRLNVDGNGCDYLRILSDLETKLRNNTNPKEKIELALQGALMFYGADSCLLYTSATRTRLTAISQKLQRQGGRMPPSHLCHRGNGRRRQRSALH